MHNKRYMCPVCGYDYLNEPPYDDLGLASFDICPSCGTEFGYNDATISHQELQDRWILKNHQWFSKTILPPSGWSAIKQLLQLKNNQNSKIDDS